MQQKFTIKTTALMLVFLISFCAKSGATKFTVTVSDFQFSPATLPNVIVGDTITWNWASGSHTTTCNPSTDPTTSLPAGAPVWNAPMNSGQQTFTYVVTTPGVYNYLCLPHRTFMKASFTVSAALPIKLSEFKVANLNNNAVLNWTTQLEDNVDYFSIEKSKTGADFYEIARVPSPGNSFAARSYNYTDANSSTTDKFFYYTIAIIDKDGRKEFSPVAIFKNNTTISKLIIALSPNPVNKSGHLMLKFNADKTGKMNVKVFDMNGRSMLETTMQAYEGVNNGHLMLGNIASGSYSVSFELDGTKEVYKLLVK